MAAPSGPEQVLFKGFASCSRAAGPPISQMEGESLVSGRWLIKLSLFFFSSDKADCRNRDKILTSHLHFTLFYSLKKRKPRCPCLHSVPLFPNMCVLKLNTRHGITLLWIHFFMYPNVATHTQNSHSLIGKSLQHTVLLFLAPWAAQCLLTSNRNHLTVTVFLLFFCFWKAARWLKCMMHI